MNHWKGKLWYAYGTSMTSIKQGSLFPLWSKLKDIPCWETKVEE